MRASYWILPLLLTAILNAQDVQLTLDAVTADDATVEVVDLETVVVSVEMINQSWFTDRTGQAVIHFDSLVETPESLPSGGRGLSFIDVEVRETPNSESGEAVAIVRFILRDTGIITFPALEFSSETKCYRTNPQQIMVGAAVLSKAMSVALNPAKRQVYVGEPLRVDLTWECDLDASRLQALNYYPPFFNDPTVEVVVPRSTEPEGQQVGLPIGGRRVIGKRIFREGQPKALGTVTLPLYLRLTKPGVYTLPATRLECAYLQQSNRNFGQYAAHFNNSLFAPEESDAVYQRLFVETAPIEIEVLALPEEGRLPNFSGLFAPVRIEVAVTPKTLKIGELIQVELKVFADAPHGMIELPLLSRQRGLRGRFLVDENMSRVWRSDGTTFGGRLRVLSTAVAAFPALHIQTFDPATRSYSMLMTEPVALTVAPQDGQEFIDLKSYKGAAVTLTEQSGGIWHNREANRMNDLINNSIVCLGSWFWLWFLLVLGGFLLLLPVVRERRCRALDVQYRARAESYAAFQKLAESDPAKWPAFLQFLAVSFDSEDKAWTVRDSEQALEAIGVSTDDIALIVELHRASDAHDYSVQHPPAQLSALNAVGKRILSLVSKAGLLLLLLGVSSMPQQIKASDWFEADQLFDQALSTQAGSDHAAALYAESALKFQAAAEAGQRPEAAWYNAGNAWFQTGALGRSIAAYRQARIYRPFDAELVDNLRAARALALSDVPDESAAWLQWPTVWLKAVLLCLILLLGVCVLVTVRYRGRAAGIASLLVLLLCCLTSGLWFMSAQLSGQHGVIITESILARKGPSYAYAAAFHEPLHDGLEFTVQETREGWARIELADGRACWLPLSQVQLIY